MGAKKFHFHWLRASEMGVMKADLVKVVKKARKVLSVMFMGNLGRDLPSYAAKTETMTIRHTVSVELGKWESGV